MTFPQEIGIIGLSSIANPIVYIVGILADLNQAKKKERNSHLSYLYV